MADWDEDLAQKTASKEFVVDDDPSTSLETVAPKPSNTPNRAPQPMPPSSDSKAKPPAGSRPGKAKKLALFGVASAIFMLVTVGVNWFIYQQWVMSAPDAKARVQAMKFVQEDNAAEAEHTLEPFVFTKNSSHECAKLLAGIYAVDNKLDKMEDALWVISCGDKKKLVDHMHFLGAPLAHCRPAVARKVLERSTAKYKELYGAEDARYAKDVFNLGICDVKENKIPDAIVRFKTALPLLERGYGKDAEITQAAAKNLLALEHSQKTVQTVVPEP